MKTRRSAMWLDRALLAAYARAYPMAFCSRALFRRRLTSLAKLSPNGTAGGKVGHCLRALQTCLKEAGDEPAPANSGNLVYASPIASSAEATTASAMPAILNGPGMWPASAIAIMDVISGEAALVSAETTIALPSRSA